jgi:hypothetical protein
MRRFFKFQSWPPCFLKKYESYETNRGVHNVYNYIEKYESYETNRGVHNVYNYIEKA